MKRRRFDCTVACRPSFTPIGPGTQENIRHQAVRPVLRVVCSSTEKSLDKPVLGTLQDHGAYALLTFAMGHEVFYRSVNP